MIMKINIDSIVSPSDPRSFPMMLSSLLPRDRFIIRAVRVAREVGRRLADMGFADGTDGVVIRRGGFGGPMQVRIHGYHLLLRREEAAQVEVDLVESGLPGPAGRRRRRGRFGSRSDFE